MVFQEFAVSVQKNQNYFICWYKLPIIPLNLVKRIITVKQKGKPMEKKALLEYVICVISFTKSFAGRGGVDRRDFNISVAILKGCQGSE